MTVLLVAAIGAGALCVMGLAVVAALSARALRRDADFEAEVRAASFAFRIRMRPTGEPRLLDERAPRHPGDSRRR